MTKQKNFGKKVNTKKPSNIMSRHFSSTQIILTHYFILAFFMPHLGTTRRLKNIIDSSDLNIAHKGLDMSFKLDGSYAPEKHLNYTISYQDITAEIERLKAEAAGEDSGSPARSGD